MALFTAPAAENDNLRAQRGWFMLQTHETDEAVMESSFVPLPYDQLAPQLLGSVELRKQRQIVRVVVSSAYGPLITQRLSLAGVTAARLFPGPWGVARELDEHRRLSMKFPADGSWMTSTFSADIHDKIKEVLDAQPDEESNS